MAKSKGRTAKRKPARAKKVRRVARKVARKVAAKPAGNGLEALARKIVKITTSGQDPFPLRELYAEGCTSTESTGQTVSGFAGLEEKLRQWESMQSGTTWNARTICTGKNRICIEWDAIVSLRDGRTVNLSEVAIHDIKGGKIVGERYYYNPMAFGPPPGASTS
jgi:hypothetical protein